MNQMKRGGLNLAAILCAMIVIGLLGSLLVGLAEMEAMPEHLVSTEIGTEMLAVSIKDVEGCKKITSFNIVKDAFVHNSRPEGAVYSHDIHDLGNRGTIQIFIENLDPMAADYNDQAALVEHLKVESSYKFSLHIPQTLAASVVYANAQYLSATGEIMGYDFIEFINQPKVTEAHISKTEPITFNISMNAERRYMSPDAPLRNGILVTIHYEAPEGKTAVLEGDILVGQREAVEEAVARSSMSLYVMQVLAIVALAMLIFVAILKKAAGILPQILYLVGVAGLYTVAVIYQTPCERPYLLLAFEGFFAAMVALGVAASAQKKLAAVPVRMILCILASGLCLCAFIQPLLAAEAERTVSLVAEVLQYVILTAACLLAAYETAMGCKIKLKVSEFAALMFLTLCILGEQRLHFFTPVFGVSILLLVITTYTGIHEIVLLEKRNRYLTDNLEAEVERQTESLSRMIGEREDLLRYVSHDLRRPVISIRKLLPDLTGTDSLAAKHAAASVENKLDTVDNTLAEISKFAKTNYHAEQSEVLSLDELLKKIQQNFAADCDANGVRLKIRFSGIEVFAKPNALFSILSNLIFNALEHSGCHTIEIAAERYGKKQCRLIVSDNGKGAAHAEKLFVPYHSTGSEEGNTGLGLYISKQFALSMGGDLLYLRDGEMTTFSIILPIV